MDDPPLRGPRDFATTQWSLVLAARTDEAQRSNARKAFEALCRAYWYPIYAFVRYRGHDSDEAQDDSTGRLAGRRQLLARWTIVWLPLLLPLAIVAWLAPSITAPVLFASSTVLLLWIGSAGLSIVYPARGLPDRVAGTWVVRR